MRFDNCVVLFNMNECLEVIEPLLPQLLVQFVCAFKKDFAYYTYDYMASLN